MPLRRPRNDDDAPRLPPLDGEVGDVGEDDEPAPFSDPDDDALPEEPASLDNSLVEDPWSDDAMDVPEDLAPGADEGDAEGPAGGEVSTGDDADEIDADDGARWTDVDPASADTGTEDLDLDEASTLGDRGEEGVENDAQDDLDELPPLDDDEEGDLTEEGFEGGAGESGEAARGGVFALPVAPSVTTRRVQGDGVMLGAVLGAGRLLVVGDALWSVALDALSDPDVTLAPLDAPDDELFTSVAEDGAGGMYLGSLLGGVYHRARRGLWEIVRHPGTGGGAGAVDQLFAEGQGLWAHTHGGSLLRRAEGTWREVPGAGADVRGIARDDEGAAVLIAAGRRSPVLRVTRDAGRTWTSAGLPGDEAPWLLVRAGGVTVIAPGAGPGAGYVSVDGGGTWTMWDILDGATALALAVTDDGVPMVLFAVDQDTDDRAVVVAAGVDASGGPRAPQRLCVVAPLADHGEFVEGDEDEATCRVAAIVPLDRAGRRIAVVASRQVLLVERGG